MKTRLKIAVGLAVLTTIGSCKSLKDPEMPEVATVPEQFVSETTDSIHSGLKRPEELFNDPLLIALIDSALTHNLTLLGSEASVQQLEADVKESRSALLPQLGALAGYSNRKFGLQTMDGAGNITTPIGDGELIPIHLNDFNLGIQSSWEIDVWGKLKARKKAALLRLSAQEETVNLLKTWITEQVLTNYFQLLILDERKQVISRNLALNVDLVEVAKAQKEAARANELSVQQFEALTLNYRNQLLLIDQEIVFTENELRQLTGTYTGSINRSAYAENPLLNAALNDGLVASVLSNRPDIRAAELELSATKADVKAARAEFYPSLSINGTLGYQAYRTRFLFSSPESIAYGLFGNIMAPLVNRGAIKADFQRATSAQLGAYYAYQETVLNAYTEINNGVFALKTSAQLVDNKEQEMEVLQNARSTAAELFNANRVDYFELLLVQQNALVAEMDYLDLKEQQFIWKIYLYKVLGGGWK